MPNLPPLSMLRAFEAAARTSSFSAAGRELNVSHAAIGQQVRKLEAHLDRALMLRAGRGLTLTADGAALARGLTEGFDALRAAVEALSAQDETRPLHITMTPNFAMTWLMPRLGRFRAAHPDIELRINPTGAVVDLALRDHDLAIRYGRGDWPGMDCTPLLRSRFLICGSPDLAARVPPDPTPEALLALPWLEEVDTEEVAIWLAEQGVVGPRPARVTVLPGFMLLSALRDGQGIACTSEMAVRGDLASGALVALHEDPAPESGYHLVRRLGPMRPPLRAFAAWLRAETRAEMRDGAAG
ncbi:MAG: LysR family glycine cleavage system transcriptional activator [Paracoccaceae bacterium]|jgi:LysR family glycine cleavage system transcriptional activator